jgi:hypothetical protein
MSYTGYWISEGHIYGPNGYTQCWIEKDHIYKVGGGYTQCWISDGHIYGTEENLPWVE